MADAAYNLVLVFDARHMDKEDFIEISRRIRSRAPDIEVFVVDNQFRRRATARQAAKRPSLVMCPFPLETFQPLEGEIYQGEWTGKIRQFKRFDELGIPTPKWTVINAETELDPAEWGPAVVVKPEFGNRGNGMMLVRTELAGEYAVSVNLPGFQSVNRNMIVQAFVDTGNPMSFYRVLSLFSEPLFCRHDLTPAPNEISDFPHLPDGGVNIAVNTVADRVRTLVDPPHVLDLARRAHNALHERPVLGIDIICEHDTGNAYVLEANPSGHCWQLSSPVGREQRKQYGFNYYSQFDALTVAAEALVDRTRAEAC